MDEIDDRRGSGRVHIMTTATLDLAGRTVQATAMDLSLSGISVWAPSGETPSARLKVTIEIDDRGPMCIEGQLARQFESDGGAVWGIAFVGLGTADHARIDAYLRTLT